MSSLLRLLPRGFSLEVSGPPGSGRRLFVARLVEYVVERGGSVLYVDLAGTQYRLCRSGSGLCSSERVTFTRPGDPAEAALLSFVDDDLVVLDSVPRLFFGFQAGYRERWGYVSSALLGGLRRASRGLGFVAVNYRSGEKSFGERVFASYFTHRVALEAGGKARLVYPYETPIA